MYYAEYDGWGYTFRALARTESAARENYWSPVVYRRENA